MNCVTRCFVLFLSVFTLVAAGVLAPGTTRAAVVFSGDISPTDSSNWNSDTDGYIGNTSDGTATIDSASSLDAKNSYIGYASGVAGEVTVTGPGSTWTMNSVYDEEWWMWFGGEVYVGYNGNGSLNIANGGVVHSRIGRIGYSSSAAGTVTVADGATWDANSQNSGELYVGCSGDGVLQVKEASSVNTKYLTVGETGVGTVKISSGGTVSSKVCYIARRSNSMGAITVTGANSLLQDPGSLFLAYGAGGTATLTVTNGGTVVAGDFSTKSDGNGTLNIMAGGMVVTDYVNCGTYDDESVSTATTVNFDGGILKANEENSSGWIRAEDYGTSNVYIKEGGATFDTNGLAMAIPISLQHGGAATADGGVIKTGAGVLTLSGDNTYIGNTTVNMGSLVLATDGSLLLDVNDATNSMISVDVGADLDLFGTIKLDLDDVTRTEGLWTLVDNDGVTTYESSFALMTSDDVAFTEVSDVWTYTSGMSLWTFSEGTGQLSLSTVPEPGTFALLACGLLGLLAYLRRKCK